ncbi:MAG: hypothetical protein GY795_17580 [Desulfobacterales bacterium]|nr:hypothetical protein [Desulfobacterales bacterium]
MTPRFRKNFIIVIICLCTYLPSNANAFLSGYIYSSDNNMADTYKSFLDTNGYSTTIIPTDTAGSSDFSQFDLIIIGNDTGSLSDEIVLKINESGLPVIGIGEGGYSFFGKNNLNTGYGNVRNGEVNEIFVTDITHPIYNLPDKINIPDDNVVQIYTDTLHIGIFLSPIPQNVTVLGREPSDNNHYPLVTENEKYLLWGFTGSPDSMTQTGKSIFINSVNYLTRDISSSDTDGDINGNSEVDLEDIIMGLKVIADISDSLPININADVNNDNRIGMEEAVYILQVIAGFFSTCSEELTINCITGKWGVDYERTLEEVKKSPKYDPEQDEQFQRLIKEMMESMTLEIKESYIIYHLEIAQQTEEAAFEVVSSSKDSLIVAGEIEGNEFELTFRLIDNEFLNVVSSATDDMTYYIWKRIE